jgi:hypothetical protein
MQALQIHAGPKALAHIREHGLRPEHIGVIPGAAGGPKGLILGPLDRFIFGEWLAQSSQPVDLVGASIGAWRPMWETTFPRNTHAVFCKDFTTVAYT